MPDIENQPSAISSSRAPAPSTAPAPASKGKVVAPTPTATQSTIQPSSAQAASSAFNPREIPPPTLENLSFESASSFALAQILRVLTQVQAATSSDLVGAIGNANVAQAKFGAGSAETQYSSSIMKAWITGIGGGFGLFSGAVSAGLSLGSIGTSVAGIGMSASGGGESTASPMAGGTGNPDEIEMDDMGNDEDEDNVGEGGEPSQDNSLTSTSSNSSGNSVEENDVESVETREQEVEAGNNPEEDDNQTEPNNSNDSNAPTPSASKETIAAQLQSVAKVLGDMGHAASGLSSVSGIPNAVLEHFSATSQKVSSLQQISSQLAGSASQLAQNTLSSSDSQRQSLGEAFSQVLQSNTNVSQLFRG